MVAPLACGLAQSEGAALGQFPQSPFPTPPTRQGSNRTWSLPRSSSVALVRTTFKSMCISQSWKTVVSLL